MEEKEDVEEQGEEEAEEEVVAVGVSMAADEGEVDQEVDPGGQHRHWRRGAQALGPRSVGGDFFP